MHCIYVLAGLASLLSHQVVAAPTSSKLPTVDLGYTVQRASSYNTTSGVYAFSNIRYAAPPLGHLRFGAPQPPLFNRTTQDPGTTARNCPQAYPRWLIALSGASYIPQTPEENEDCLYLDVFTPKKSLENAKKGCADAPVLVWIHGGGAVLGSKTSNGEPSGLLAQKYAREKNMVFVAMNYRLGTFGFLNGPQFKSEFGTANAGLLDQRFAIEWIQNNIHKFGGSVDNVTLMGESGGAQSIVAHLSANQDKYGKLAIKQALLQSVAGFPVVSSATQDGIFERYKSMLNVSNLEQMRSLNTMALQRANHQYILNAAYGDFLVRVEEAADGYVRTSPARSILTAGRQNHPNIQVMVGQNTDEGAIFVDPKSNASFASYIAQLIPLANTSTTTHIQSLYPPADPSTPVSEFNRKRFFAADLLFNCNGYAAQKAYPSQGYGYIFAVPPAYHTFDLPYTWFNGSVQDLGNGDARRNATVASVMQAFFTTFAVAGKPNLGGFPEMEMPRYGEGKVLRLGNEGLDVVVDPNQGERCEYLIRI